MGFSNKTKLDNFLNEKKYYLKLYFKYQTRHAAHFKNLGWRNYTCFHSQFKIVNGQQDPFSRKEYFGY